MVVGDVLVEHVVGKTKAGTTDIAKPNLVITDVQQIGLCTDQSTRVRMAITFPLLNQALCVPLGGRQIAECRDLSWYLHFGLSRVYICGTSHSVGKASGGDGVGDCTSVDPTPQPSNPPTHDFYRRTSRVYEFGTK